VIACSTTEMSALHFVAVLRPLRAQLQPSLARAPGFIGVSIHITPQCQFGSIAPRKSVLTLRVQQLRSYSSPREGKRPAPQEQRPLTWGEAFAAIRQSLNFGPLFNAFRGSNLRRLYRQSPEELVIALALYVGPPSR
jgi:hypothetical protein